MSLSESSTPLGMSVDFVVGDYGIVYVKESEMNGKVSQFMPRILTLIYQHKYLEKTRKITWKQRQEAQFEFAKKLVYIHQHPDNSEKALSLQLFCSDHGIDHVLVEDAFDVYKLLGYIAKNGGNRERFIQPTFGSIADSGWTKDGALLNGSLRSIILKLPYVNEKNNEEVISYFKSMGSMINADRDKLRIAFGQKKSKFVYDFFR